MQRPIPEKPPTAGAVDAAEPAEVAARAVDDGEGLEDDGCQGGGGEEGGRGCKEAEEILSAAAALEMQRVAGW